MAVQTKDRKVSKMTRTNNNQAKHMNQNVVRNGGQKRKAAVVALAIAGVLAMRPEVLVLDEPCAGLDPRGRAEILSLIRGLHAESGRTIVMVSHSMDDVAHLAERVIVMDHGRISGIGTHEELLKENELYREIHESQMGGALFE